MLRSVLALILLVGCASPKPGPEISRSSIHNPRVGLKGYHLELPEGFEVVPRETPPDSNRHPLAFTLAQQLQKQPPPRWPSGKLKASETHILSSDKIVVLFRVQILDNTFPFRNMSKKEREKIFQMIANHHAGWNRAVMVTEAPAEYLAYRDNVSAKGYEGRIALESRAVIGARNEIYYFWGAAPIQLANALHETVEDFVARLKS
jgi:hypothetical protein